MKKSAMIKRNVGNLENEKEMKYECTILCTVLHKQEMSSNREKY